MEIIPNYLIDRKLKQEKHFPSELNHLINFFEIGIKAIPEELLKLIEIKNPYDRRRINDDIKLIKKTFLDFFLNRANLIKYEKYYQLPKYDPNRYKTFDDFKTDYSKALMKLNQQMRRDKEILKEQAAKESGPCDLKVVFACVERINRRLRNINPRIQSGPGGYHLDPVPFLTSDNVKRFQKRPSMIPLVGWGWLAVVIDRLDPRLVHQCAYCGKIFFSKQIKKFHPECRSKYFSEKAVREGLAAKHQREYRQRLKKKSKGR